MNYIFYQTKTKFTNTGDALINRALITTLRSYGKLYANCSSEIPDMFIQELGISNNEKLDGTSELSFVKNVLKCSLLKKKDDNVYLFSGLGDSYGGTPKQVIRNILSSLTFALFRISGVKVVRIGRSVGPLTKAMQLTERFRSIFLSYNFVRDSKTLDRCRNYGIKKAEFCPDMSWLYDINGVRTINDTGTIMVNLRNAIFDDSEIPFVNATLNSLESVLEIFASHYGENLQILVAFQIDEDAAFSKQIYERLKNKYNVTYINHQMRMSELAGYYGMVDFHISNRMHSLLLGYKYGSLPLALVDVANHTKISATLKDCDLESLMIDIYDNRFEKVKELISNRDTLMNKIFATEIDMQNKIYDKLKVVFKSDPIV